MFVFDTNNIFNQYQLYKSKQDYLKQKKYYYKEIEKIKEENEALFGNDEKLEKFAREKYLMKKDSETIFVFEYDTIQKK
jgi:cell division protein DivIC